MTSALISFLRTLLFQVAAVLLLVIYGGYFLATCWGSRRIVRGG